MRLAFILLSVVVLSFPAYSQDGGYHGDGHDQWHSDFYSKLLVPGRNISCCNLADCRPTKGRQINDHYEVEINGKWVAVLPEKVVKKSAPDQGYHVCAPHNFSGKPEHVYCVILPPES